MPAREKRTPFKPFESRRSKQSEQKNHQIIRLLLVDDEMDFLDVLSKRLEKRGFVVTKAYSGTEGIRKVREQTFHLAIIDLKMEEMDGIEVLKIFKKMAPYMQILMLTGHGSQTAAQEGIKLGVFDYLSKPCDIDDLVAKITEACGCQPDKCGSLPGKIK